MRIPVSAALVLTLVRALSAPGSAGAAAFDVPGTHATLQLAVAAAAVSADMNNTITLSVSPVTTNATINIGAAFGPTRRLVIAPAAPLVRASIANTTPGALVINMQSAANVTIQDLDILRNITNNNDIVNMNLCDDIVIERCRIGSNWTTSGTPGWACVRIHYPTGVILRNNIMFSRIPGTFDFGIDAGSFNDPANSLRLYNNVVSDYRIYGIRIEAAVGGALVLLRNNVAANYTNLAPEPVAYRSEALNGGPMVVTSHNVAFASAGFVQTGGAGTQDIAGLPSSFLTFVKGDAVFAFVTRLWTSAPPWDANANFYRLVNGGPLHNAPGDWGMTVATAGQDIAVLDDIEKDWRPGGAPAHSDRGADQLEPGATSGIEILDTPHERVLQASVRRSPSGGMVLRYAVPEAGRLELRLVDVTGRLLHSAGRSVDSASSGTFEWPNAARPGSGIVFYRLTLRGADGSALTTSGKAVRIR